MLRAVKASLPVISLFAATILSGCSAGRSLLQDQRPAAIPAAATGMVHGGQQPVSNAAIQLYAVGKSGDGSAASPLLLTTVTTSDGSGQLNGNSNAGNGFNTFPAGSFSITDLYTCSSPTDVVYLTATGGNPGLGASVNNSTIQLFDVLGQCGTLSSSTFLVVNEVTTIGGLAALFPYVNSISSIGYNAGSDAAAFAAALDRVNQYVNRSTGYSPGPALPANTYASTYEINALADVVAACVNSTGGSVSDGSVCGQLFGYATPPSGAPPSNVFNAALNILNNPSQNVSNLFALISASAPFQPIPATAPPQWTLPILPMAAAPTFSPDPGTYVAGLPNTSNGGYVLGVTASSATASNTIYCTTNGTTPTTASQVEDQTQGIPIGGSTTIQCIATAPNFAQSVVTRGQFTLKAPPPSIAKASGTYSGSVMTSIFSFYASGQNPNAVIYYTLNGSQPTLGSTKYTSPITVTQSSTLKAIVYIPGMLNSDVASETYTIQ